MSGAPRLSLLILLSFKAVTCGPPSFSTCMLSASRQCLLAGFPSASSLMENSHSESLVSHTTGGRDGSYRQWQRRSGLPLAAFCWNLLCFLDLWLSNLSNLSNLWLSSLSNSFLYSKAIDIISTRTALIAFDGKYQVAF